MRRRISEKYHLLNGGKILALAVLTGVVVVGILSTRALQTNRIDRRVCEKIDRLDTALITLVRNGAKSLPTIAYYQDHPDELRAALEANRASIRQLRSAACNPGNLTSGP